jgi:hypothetical protein
MFSETLYKKAYGYYAREVMEHCNLTEESLKAFHIYHDDASAFGLIHEGVFTKVSPWVYPWVLEEMSTVGMRAFMSEDLQVGDSFEQDLLNYIEIQEEMLATKAFITGYALFPVPMSESERILGETIATKFHKNLKSLETYSDPKEWTPATQAVMDQYIADHERVIDKISNRILSNKHMEAVFK